jgi:hypothetical protein
MYTIVATTASELPPLWSSSQEFLAANTKVPGSIPGATRFSE